jgi:dephospho-CoA kinase
MLLGITGGIATGKSTVARFLHERANLTTFDADACVHELLATDHEVISAIRLEFSLPETPIDRAALRQIVFLDPEARRRLESILHPIVRAKWQALTDDCRANGRCLLADIPLLFETGAAPAFDATIVVAASPQVQQQRLVSRGLEQEMIDAMLASQWPIRQKIALANHVIWNDGSLAELERQCVLLLDALFPTRHE